MRKDSIVYIKINEEGQLHIKPEILTFPMIYRSASEVNWNSESKTLFSPRPRDWSYINWFNHIIDIAQGDNYCKLEITSKTMWINIPIELRKEIEQNANR